LTSLALPLVLYSTLGCCTVLPVQAASSRARPITDRQSVRLLVTSSVKQTSSPTCSIFSTSVPARVSLSAISSGDRRLPTEESSQLAVAFIMRRSRGNDQLPMTSGQGKGLVGPSGRLVVWGRPGWGRPGRDLLCRDRLRRVLLS